MKSLLEKARDYKPRTRGPKFNATDQHIELAIAWAKGNVSFTQAMIAITGKHNTASQMYATLAMSLRGAILKGKLIENP